MDRNKELLEAEIGSEFEALATMTPGSEEHKSAVEDLERLYKLKNEAEKAELELVAKRDSDKARQKFDWLNLAVTAGLAIGNIVAFNAWYNRGLKFEETGVVSSPQVRNLMNKLIPKK